MEENTSLGQFISLRRKHLRLTQEELGIRIGVSKSAIAKWETNGGLPDRDNLKRLAQALGVTVEEIYRIIDRSVAEKPDLKVNITPEVIATLESYGYKVIRPGDTEGI